MRDLTRQQRRASVRTVVSFSFGPSHHQQQSPNRSRSPARRLLWWCPARGRPSCRSTFGWTTPPTTGFLCSTRPRTRGGRTTNRGPSRATSRSSFRAAFSAHQGSSGSGDAAAEDEGKRSHGRFSRDGGGGQLNRRAAVIIMVSLGAILHRALSRYYYYYY